MGVELIDRVTEPTDSDLLKAHRAGDAAAFDAFLLDQPDLGPKWVPSFVRVTPELPKLASMKIDKQLLRREAWRGEPVFWRPAKGASLRRLSGDDRGRLEPLLPVG